MPKPILQATPTPPAPPAAPVIAPAQSLGELQAQAQALSDQLTVLVSQSKGLAAQVRVTRGAARADASQALRVVTSQVSEVSGQLANVRAQIAFRQLPQAAQEQQILVPPRAPDIIVNHGRNFDPDLVAGLMFAIIFAVLMPISIGIARRLWRRGANPPQPQLPDNISPRLERLEQAIDAVAIEIERISEGQRFVTKVMTERPAESRNAPQSAARDAAAGNDQTPFRALGAGPIEPIRAAERQAVRQANTPH